MRTKGDLAFSLALLAVMAWMVWQATGWQLTASLFPIVVGLPALALAAVQVGVAGRRAFSSGGDALEMHGSVDLEPELARRRTWEMSGWIVVFMAGVVVLGFRLSAALLPFLFMKVAAKESWRASMLLGLGTYAAFCLIFVTGLHLVLPAGALADALGVQSFDAYITNPLGSIFGG